MQHRKYFSEMFKPHYDVQIAVELLPSAIIPCSCPWILNNKLRYLIYRNPSIIRKK